VVLNWQPPASGAPILRYVIYRGDWGKETFLAETNGPVTTYNDTSGGAWVYYFYKVAAVNAAGQGPFTPDVGGQRTG
jgi:hypothetical protein